MTIHYGWKIAVTMFIFTVYAQTFRSTTTVFIMPIHDELGYSIWEISSAASTNLVIYGLTVPLSGLAINMFGPRVVIQNCCLIISLGVLLVPFFPAHLTLIWGFMVGPALGLSIVAPNMMATRFFDQKRGLVVGILGGAVAAGQLLFLPPMVWVTERFGWRATSYLFAASGLPMAGLARYVLVEWPEDVGATPYGSTSSYKREITPKPPFLMALATYTQNTFLKPIRTWTFWVLTVSFGLCGWTTLGIIQTHMIPTGIEHEMPPMLSASLLTVVGLMDLVGTTLSGILTDKVQEPKYLLSTYYLLRGIANIAIPFMMGPTLSWPLIANIVFLGLDYIAAMPPTFAIATRKFGAAVGPPIFGWILGAHMIGAAIGAGSAGYMHDYFGTYDGAWYFSGVMAIFAGLIVLTIPGKETHYLI